jgi:hypothetical protein
VGLVSTELNMNKIDAVGVDVGRVSPLDLLDRVRNGVSGQYAKFA